MEFTSTDLDEIEDGFSRLGVYGDGRSGQLEEGIDDGALLGTSSAGGHGPVPAARRPALKPGTQ